MCFSGAEQAGALRERLEPSSKLAKAALCCSWHLGAGRNRWRSNRAVPVAHHLRIASGVRVRTALSGAAAELALERYRFCSESASLRGRLSRNSRVSTGGPAAAFELFLAGPADGGGSASGGARFGRDSARGGANERASSGSHRQLGPIATRLVRTVWRGLASPFAGTSFRNDLRCCYRRRKIARKGFERS